jgi:integrase
LAAAPLREDRQIIQEALGHASIATTTMYAHMATPTRLAETHAVPGMNTLKEREKGNLK